MDKNLYIGDFRVRNCSPYGEYKTIKSLDLGDELKIQYDASEKLIVVLAKKIVEKKGNDSNKCELDKEWAAIGELEMPVHVRRVVVPLLQGNQNRELFECQVSQINKNQSINNQLCISIRSKSSVK